ESYELHAPQPRAGAEHDQKQVGPDHLYVLDHGPGVESGTRLLFGDEGGADRHGSGSGVGAWTAWHHRQLSRSRTDRDRPADEPAVAGAEAGLFRANGGQALGPDDRHGWTCPDAR